LLLKLSTDSPLENLNGRAWAQRREPPVRTSPASAVPAMKIQES
jgi:hypothetical protein